MPDDDAVELEEGSAQPHALWSGSISFGLLSLPVDLFPANRSEVISLRMVDDHHRPLKRRYFCPKHERMLTRDEIVRGYEIDKEHYVVVSDEELESVAPEKSRAIDLRRFVKASEIDPMFFKRSYFLTPGEQEANRAYRLLAETMERSDRVGIATFVMRGKEYLVALLAERGILRAETLRFADELRRPQDVGLSSHAKASRSNVQRYMRAISELAEDEIDRGELRDSYIARLRELIDTKLERGVDVEHAPEVQEEAETEAEIIDLMEVLKRRLQPESREPAQAANGGGRQTRQGGADGGAARGKRSALSSKRAAADDLSDRSRNELYERAKALQVPGRSKMDKDELVRALRKAEG